MAVVFWFHLVNALLTIKGWSSNEADSQFLSLFNFLDCKSRLVLSFFLKKNLLILFEVSEKSN